MTADIHLLPLISTRVCLYRPYDRDRIIVRHSRDKKRVVLPGGKLNSHSLETLEEGARREIKQETLFDLDTLELVALLPCARLVQVDSEEARELGVSRRRIPSGGLPGLVTLEVVFASPVTGKVPSRPVEGRTISEIRLTPKSIAMFKERHQRAAEICRGYLETGKKQLRSRERKLMGNFERLLAAR